METVMAASYGLGNTKRKRGFRWGYLFFMCALALLGMSFATQNVAEFFGYHAALGQGLCSAFGRTWYAPWSIFFWERKFPDTYGVMSHYTMIGQAIFLAPQFLVLGHRLFFSRKLTGLDDLHGSAHWADENDIRAMGYLENAGVYVGGWFVRHTGWLLIWSYLTLREPGMQYYLRHNGPEHILCFAPTRSGKGVGLILPTLLAWEGSTLVLDIKGENWSLTSGYRQSIGQKVFRFEPSDPSGAAACFNPLEEIRLDTLHAIPDAQNIAMMIVDPEGKGLQDHWGKAGFAFMSGVLMHCLVMIRHKEKRSATLHDLGNMLADETRTIKDLFAEMLETDHAACMAEIFPDGATGGDKVHTFVAGSAREMLNKAENEASGVVSTALVNLALYRDPVVALNTSRCDFRIRDLMHHDTPVNVYLVTSPNDTSRLRPLLRLILNLVVGRICEKMEFSGGTTKAYYKHRLLFMLDEFTELGKMDIIERAIAFIAGYGGKMYIIVQDVGQLNAKYGDKNAIMPNCHTRIAYAPNTIETAKLLSDMAGKTTIVAEKLSLSGSRAHLKNASVNVNETARPLLTPDECMRLPGARKDSQGRVTKPGDMLIFTAGQSPIYGRQILYFRDPTFSRRAKIPAPGQNSEFPDGITDSLYHPRPKAWYAGIASSEWPEGKPLQHTLHPDERNSYDYLQ